MAIKFSGSIPMSQSNISLFLSYIFRSVVYNWFFIIVVACPITAQCTMSRTGCLTIECTCVNLRLFNSINHLLHFVNVVSTFFFVLKASLFKTPIFFSMSSSWPFVQDCVDSDRARYHTTDDVAHHPPLQPIASPTTKFPPRGSFFFPPPTGPSNTGFTKFTWSDQISYSKTIYMYYNVLVKFINIL